MKQRCNFSFPARFFTFAGTLALALSAVPAANAMVASIYEEKFFGFSTSVTETHNTDYSTATTDISEIWNRTVWIAGDGGTATYLGRAADGSHLILTAYHVGMHTMTITATDGSTYDLIANKNWRIGTADLKIYSVFVDDETSDFLDSLGNIDIYTGTPTTSTELYTVGTGKSTAIGSSYTTGTREKQWAEFKRNNISVSGEDGTVSTVDTVSVNTAGATNCYAEVFSNKETSFQATQYDSGSGVFVYQNGEWLLVGTLLAVAGDTESATAINYSGAENSVCFTLFADLSQYAGQINEIMSIPEPSAFGLLAGTFALAVAVSRRSRKKRA
ncbi:MAG: hypothetical protein IJW12_03770 [Opitutales bacterium]|nr:hypothetical protein [Opitutales bacterium]